MKKTLCVLIALALCLGCLCAAAEELTRVEAPEVKWDFPVSLSAIESKYAILVNADNMLDAEFKPSPQVKVKGVKCISTKAIYMEEGAANALKAMFDAAAQVTEYTYVNAEGKEKTAKYDADRGMVLYLKSGYRSYGTQATTYKNYMDTTDKDDGSVVVPGASEHQTGICADILSAEYEGDTTMTKDFMWTPEAQWMKENCAEFGFILRYPEEAEAITGVKFEPWHFRYVGEEIAWYITSRGITLEEFTNEALFAVAEFVGRGGDVEHQVAYEYYRLNAPPESNLLDISDETGDYEVSLLL